MPITLDGTLGITTPALTVDGATVNTGGISTAGNLVFSSTGQRITGDFSNGTIGNRVLFQTSTTNGATRVNAIPNGTSAISDLTLWNNSDPANAANARIYVSSSEMGLVSQISGTGTYIPIVFGTSGSERMRIDTSGNVGVGTSSPSTYGNFAVAGTGGVQTFVASDSGSNTSFRGYSIGLVGSSTIYGSLKMELNGGELRLTSGYSGFGGFQTFYTAGSERMRIDTSGNVGIGSNSPSQPVELVKNQNGSTWYSVINTNAGTGAAVGYLMANNTGTLGALQLNSSTNTISGAGDAVVLRTLSTNPLCFGTNSTEAMRIDSSGNVGIGSNSPTSKLHVVSSGKGLLVESGVGGYTALGFKCSGGVSASITTTSNSILIGSLNASGTGSNGEFAILPSPSSINRLQITANGAVQMPYQPSFFAAKTGSAVYTVGNPILFNTVPTNVGSNYSAATGRFTAPVYGVYYFSMKNLQTNAASVIRFYFYLNGAQADTTYGLSAADGAYQSRFESTTGNYKEQQTSAIMTLNAGDYVTVVQKVGTASVDDNGYSTFLGHLIG